MTRKNSIIAMINLMEKFIKKSKVHGPSKIDKILSKNINDVLRPVYILSIIFGLRVFEFPGNHSRPILSFIYSMSFFSLYYFCWFYRQDESNIFRLEGFVSYIFTIANHIVIIVLLIMGLYQSESSKLCAKRINEIDKTLRKLGSSSSFNNIYKITIRDLIIVFIYIVILYTIIITGITLTNHCNNINILFIISLWAFQYLYSSSVEFLMLIEFITIVRCIKSEFQRGNELLSDVNILPISSIASEIIDRKETDGSLFIERFLPVDSKKLFTSISSSSQTQSKLQVANYKINRSKILLRTIRQVHLELYKVSRCFSKMYGIQISLEMAMCVMCSTNTLYDFYQKYMNEICSMMNLTFQIVTMILCFSQYSLRICIVNYICDRTTKEATRTSEIIHTFYGKNMDVEIQREVEIFSMQLMQFRNAYTAYDLYNFDCKQICSCIGVITTYLVILIQVADSLRKGS